MKQYYHRKTLRLRDYDYSQGAYFVTICAARRKCLFGKIIDGKMKLSQEGQIVREEWQETAVRRPYLRFDEFVVMPNHFHAVLIVEIEQGTARRAPTREKFGAPIPGSLPSILRSFKAAVARRISPMLKPPGTAIWQRGFYEHVIRNDESLNCIREYIRNNPLLWELDRENPDCRAENKFYRWLASFKTRAK
jgi:putative transposase